MDLGLIFLFSYLALAIIILWPIKLKILKKHDQYLSNTEILKLAEQGDPDAKRLKRLTKNFFIGGIFVAIFFVLTKHSFINF